MLNIVDEFTREALAMEVDRSITADSLIGVIEGLVVLHGAPRAPAQDNGPELLSGALRDWCRFTGTRTVYIEPGSPWENPFVESFNRGARDELFNIEEFPPSPRPGVIVEAWRMEYNTYRPHSSLGRLTPAEFAAQWVSEHEFSSTQHTTPVPTAPQRAT